MISLQRKHALIGPAFLNPRIFNAIRYGQAHPVVVDASTVEVDGSRFTLEHPEEISLVPGQQVYVTLHGDFYLETAEEREAKEARAREERERAQADALEKRYKLADEAAAFNAQFQLPVPWQAGIKDVLSGLSATSNGDGRNARTVVHFLLLEDLHDGRLRRQAGDLLCTSAGGNNGKQWCPGAEQTLEDRHGNMIQEKITCQQCVKLAERWNVGGTR